MFRGQVSERKAGVGGSCRNREGGFEGPEQGGDRSPSHLGLLLDLVSQVGGWVQVYSKHCRLQVTFRTYNTRRRRLTPTM